MKLSDYKGEDAIEVLADIIEPLALILSDKDIRELLSNKKDGTAVAPIKLVKPALKNHKREVLEILARIENMPVDEYAETVNVFTLPKQVLDFVNDPNVQSLFTSQHQTSDN